MLSVFNNMNIIEKVLVGWILGMLVFALVCHKFLPTYSHKGWCIDAIFVHGETNQRVHNFYKDKTEALQDLESVGRQDLEKMSFGKCPK